MARRFLAVLMIVTLGASVVALSLHSAGGSEIGNGYRGSFNGRRVGSPVYDPPERRSPGRAHEKDRGVGGDLYPVLEEVSFGQTTYSAGQMVEATVTVRVPARSILESCQGWLAPLQDGGTLIELNDCRETGRQAQGESAHLELSLRLALPEALVERRYKLSDLRLRLSGQDYWLSPREAEAVTLDGTLAPPRMSLLDSGVEARGGAVQPGEVFYLNFRLSQAGEPEALAIRAVFDYADGEGAGARQREEWIFLDRTRFTTSSEFVIWQQETRGVIELRVPLWLRPEESGPERVQFTELWVRDGAFGEKGFELQPPPELQITDQAEAETAQ